MTHWRASGSVRSGRIVLSLGAFGRVRWRGIVVDVVVGSLCGVCGLLGRVRDARRIEGTRVLGSACELSRGIDVWGFLKVVATPRICRGRIHRGTARERAGGVLDWCNAKLILLDDLIDPWLTCGGGRGLMTLWVTIGRQRLGRRRVVRGVGGVGIETRLGLPTGEIKIIVSSHVSQFRFGHSRASFSSVEPLYESNGTSRASVSSGSRQSATVVVEDDEGRLIVATNRE